MVIKVIDDKPHKSVVKEAICSNCGVTLEYVPADIEERMVTDYTGDSDVIRFIRCPKCQHQHTVRSY